MTAVRIRARLSRDGVQQYEGRRELRPVSEVFSAASLATLEGLRVQISHDANAPQVGRVLPGSVGREQVGRRHYVTAVLAVDASTAATLRASREPYQISMGYGCEVVMASGVTADGEAYDAVQRQIRFDVAGAHVALLDPRTHRARCGETCSIQKDSDEMVIRHSDGGEITADACECSQAEKDKRQGYIDGTADAYNVPAHLLEAELKSRGVVATLDSTREAATAVLARFGRSRPVHDAAQFHNNGRFSPGAVRQDARTVEDTDAEFRRVLQLRSGLLYGHTDATGNDVTETAVKAAAPGASPEVLRNILDLARQLAIHGQPADMAIKQAATSVLGAHTQRGDAVDDSDDAFRAALAAKSGGTL